MAVCRLGAGSLGAKSASAAGTWEILVGNLVNTSAPGAIGCGLTEVFSGDNLAVAGVNVGSLIKSCFLAAALAEICFTGIAAMFSLRAFPAVDLRAAETGLFNGR